MLPVAFDRSLPAGRYAPPEEMRRLALGGDVIEISTRLPFDVQALTPIEGIVTVRQTGPRQLLFVATDAGTATPRVNDAIEGAGGDVEYSREYRPTFDEVFAELVTAHSDGRAAGDSDGGLAVGQMPQVLARPR